LGTTRYLVTGATGYIGRRLTPRLLESGTVRCLARNPERLRAAPWADRCEIYCGDLLDADSVARACEDIDVLYYLVHSLGDRSFAAVDQRAAQITAEAAQAARVRRIVYLGGLHPGGVLSAHLASRAEVGEILLASGVPTAVLQAAVIIGSGSTSFEMLRYLTERLPAMITPRWVGNRIQPIAIDDVLRYLVEAARLPSGVNRTFDIGGPEVLTYVDMMQRFAAVAGLRRRRIMQVPALTPRLSAHWVTLVTPVPRMIAAQLVESLVHEVVCAEQDIAEYISDPPNGRVGFEQAVGLALASVGNGHGRPERTSAGDQRTPAHGLPTDPAWSGGKTYTIRHARMSAVDADQLWRRVACGSSDRWRVEELHERSVVRVLRLRTEQRMPGRAWLEMSVTSAGAFAHYSQRFVFAPRGLAGLLYWWITAPVRRLALARLARSITRRKRTGAVQMHSNAAFARYSRSDTPTTGG
jgi:uncharacterized protein YbjT (DUF2867 family)